MKYFQLQALSRKWLNKTGVTLVELLVTVAIFMLLATLVIGSTRSFDALAARMSIETIFARCMSLQRAALATHATRYLEFDPIRHEYKYDATVYQLPKGVTFGFLPGSSGPPSSPQKPINKPITFKNNRMVFHPNGIIEPGTVYIVHKKSHTMYALSSPIAQFSLLRKYRYAGKRWHLV